MGVGTGAQEGLAALEERIAALEAERRATADLLDFVAHELMTPVTSLEAFSFILGRDTKVGAEATGKRCLEGITRNTQRLVALVDEMLEIGRLRVGRTELEKNRFDLRDVARSDLIKAAAAAVGCKLEVKLGPEPLPVLADRHRVEQLVAELVRDCGARAPEGTPVCLALTLEDGRARVVASDCGTSVGPDRLVKAFRGLRRTADARPAGDKGGLGLALGNEVLLRSGGSFGAAAAAAGAMAAGVAPKGNAIWFELPLAGA